MPDRDALLTRDATAAALSEAGFPVAPTTLATKATRGGGPPFRKFGPRPLYRWGDALDWARSRLGPPMRSTSEADVSCGLNGARRVGTVYGALPTCPSASDHNHDGETRGGMRDDSWAVPVVGTTETADP
jgi:hypothetical protein